MDRVIEVVPPIVERVRKEKPHEIHAIFREGVGSF
jgi:hypothetical protein